MQDVQAGSRIALGELYDRFAPRAYRTAMSVCHDRDCAEDAVQDAFVSMWASRATYRPERGAVERWALSIVRHRAIYLARRRSVGAGPSEATQFEQQAAGDDVPGDFAARVETEQLERLLARLPRAQQQVIRLGFFSGLTHKEIASQLGLPAGTVKGRIRLGLSKLRDGLDPLRTRMPAASPRHPALSGRRQRAAMRETEIEERSRTLPDTVSGPYPPLPTNRDSGAAKCVRDTMSSDPMTPAATIRRTGATLGREARETTPRE